ncbi:hypothetical protein M5689_024607 [Euphorbia peplus]|nr:hypothetical protein M5689_024607 [Euphorbia peplus]
MNCISWNCRGLGNPRAVRCLGDLLKSQNPNLVFLIETLVYSSKIESLRRKFNFNYKFVVDCRGHSGGLVVLWKNSLDASVTGYSDHHIELSIHYVVHGDLRCVGFYGFSNRNDH